MSIILDALRRGRARETRRNPDNAHTDAVLHTLGYARFNPLSPVNRLKRAARYLLLCAALVAALWNAVMVTRMTRSASRAPAAREDHFARAVMYQRRGDFENALVSYRQALQQDERNVEAYTNLGALYRDKGLLDEAIRQFERAIAIDPGNAGARSNLVESLVIRSTIDRHAGRPDEARQRLTRALEIEPRHAEANHVLRLLEDEAGGTPRAK